MPTYILTNKENDFECVFTYSENGLLKAFELRSEMSEKNHIAFLQYDFSKQEALQKFASKNTNRKLELVPEDLSFERFLETYNHKVGKKERAQKLWEALTTKEKITCLNTIPRYKAWLAFRNIETLYPETFLSQKRFQNEYR